MNHRILPSALIPGLALAAFTLGAVVLPLSALATAPGPASVPAGASSAGANPPCCAACGDASPLPDRSVYQLNSTWTNDHGKALRLADFRGHPVVLAMIFTHCAYACPRVVSEMHHLRDTLPGDLRESARFVLVTFDSEGDTPAVLRAYRARMGLGDNGWDLLRGPADSTRELAMVLGVSYAPDGTGSFTHSSLVTVLDSSGQIAYQRPDLDGALDGAARAVAAAR